MKTRVITAIIALALFVGILLLPPIVFTIALAAVTLVMLYECYTTTKADTAMKVVGLVSAVLMMLSMYVVLYMISNMISPPYRFDIGKVAIGFIGVFVVVTFIVLLYMIFAMIKHGKRNYKDILSSGFMTVYIAVSMWCILFCKEIFGTHIMLIIFICAWTCDTFAYFSGRLFGKHKLIPHVSPNKTVEGAIGGVVGSLICSLLYLFILNRIPQIYLPFNLRYAVFFGIVGLIGGICSQIGDLIASSIKRDEDIKDFGWIFPGHGGFMDRFDSVMFIAPIILIIIVGGLSLSL